MIIIPMLCSPSRLQKIPLPYWRNCPFDEGDMGQGECSIEIPMDYCPVPNTFRTMPYGWSLDVLVIDPGVGSAVRWSGPIVEFTDARGPDGVWIRTCHFEAWIYHFLRRRLAIQNNYVPWSEYSGSLSWIQIALQNILASLNVSPAAYPGRQNAYPGTRGDWGDWTVTVRPYAGNDPVHLGDTGKYLWAVESGNTFWELMSDICAKANLRIIVTETAPGVFEIDIRNKDWTSVPAEGGYTGTLYDVTYDLSHRVLLSPIIGNARVLGRTETYRALATTFSSRGKGQTTPTDFQYAYWARDIVAETLYGKFEDGSTALGGADNTAALVDKATLFVDTRGVPVVTWQVEVGWTPPGLRPVLDWGRWYKVGVHDQSISPTTETLECVGWSASCEGPGAEPQFEMHIGAPLLDWDARSAKALARFGGLEGGGLDLRKAS